MKPYTPILKYNLPYITEEDIKEAEELRSKLYETHNSVLVFPQGSWGVIIEASDPITS